MAIKRKADFTGKTKPPGGECAYTSKRDAMIEHLVLSEDVEEVDPPKNKARVSVKIDGQEVAFAYADFTIGGKK